MKIDKQTTLERLDIQAFYGRFFPSLKDTGKSQALVNCTFHDDKNPSLSINLEDGRYNCFSCGAKGDVFKFYQDLKKVDFPTAIKDLADMAGITETQVKQKVVAKFEYKDVDGKTFYSKERLEPGKNGRSKEFRFKNHLTSKPERGCDPVLYNLPELINSKYAVIGEGEGKVDLLKSWGLVGTCLDSGANSPWKDEYTKVFEGKEKVVILPDNDSPGRSYASKIAKALNGKVGSLKVVELPGLQEAEDVVDWSRIAGNDKAKLLEIIKEAPEWIPIEEPKSHIEFSDEWPEPLSLPEGLPPVKALDPDMIPEPLRKWLMDISDRMQIPPDFSTAAAVVAAGSIIGRGCGIYPKRHDDWLVVSNLWGSVIGRPSLMKTPAITEAQRHLVRLETEARDKYTEEAHSSEIDKEIQKITRAAIAEDIKKAVKAENSDAVDSLRTRLAGLNAEEPVRRRFQTQDGTTEKIGELLIQNPRGLLVNRDELIGWFYSLDKAGREGDRAFYLEAWNGARGYTYDRIGRGTLDIDALCISVFGAITPGPLSDYVYQASRGGNGDGLLQRFQVMVWPDTPSEWKNVDRFPDSKEKERAWGIFSKLALDGLGSSLVGQFTGEIPALRFSPSGQEIFDAWRHDLEIRLRSDHGLPPSLESHLAKYRSLMPSLSLIFHLVEVVDGKSTGAVSETAALMAASWCDYLETHAMRVYGGATMPGMESAREIIKHIRRGAITDRCKPKDIYRNQWSRLATPEEVKAGLDVLSEYDWLTIEKINTGGRPSEIVRLNPGIKV